jgi:hypothetical protein
MPLPVESLHFSGHVLRRGFWLYVCRIDCTSGPFVYVGRTGDSSSVKAASPFSRVSRHLDLRPNARANALARGLWREGIDAATCRYEFCFIGPIHPETDDRQKHRERRDNLAAVESALARELGARGFRVLGSHGSRGTLDRRLFRRVLAALPETLSGPGGRRRSES